MIPVALVLRRWLARWWPALLGAALLAGFAVAVQWRRERDAADMARVRAELLASRDSALVLLARSEAENRRLVAEQAVMDRTAVLARSEYRRLADGLRRRLAIAATPDGPPAQPVPLVPVPGRSAVQPFTSGDVLAALAACDTALAAADAARSLCERRVMAAESAGVARERLARAVGAVSLDSARSREATAVRDARRAGRWQGAAAVGILEAVRIYLTRRPR